MLGNPTHFIYRHVRPDTGGIFYVGKGTLKNRRPRRQLDIRKMNPIWSRIVVKAGGFIPEVVMLCQDNKEAVTKEREFIKLYGRIDLGTGCLSNMTDGGEGASGRKSSPESIAKRVLHTIGKPRPQHVIDAISGGRHWRATRVIDDSSGHIYGCISDAANAIQRKKITVWKWLTGVNPNKSSLRIL